MGYTVEIKNINANFEDEYVYTSYYFDFDNYEEASEFMKIALEHGKDVQCGIMEQIPM